MSVQTLAPAPLHDNPLPPCPHWCQLDQDVTAFSDGHVTVGPARIHSAVLLDGPVKIRVERYDEIGHGDDLIGDVEVTIWIGDVWTPLTPVRALALRDALNRLDRLGGAR